MRMVRQLAPIAAIVVLLIGLGVTAVIMTARVSATSRQLQTAHAEQRPAAMLGFLSESEEIGAAMWRAAEATLPKWSHLPNDPRNVAALDSFNSQLNPSGSMELYTVNGQFLAAGGNKALAFKPGDPHLRKLLNAAEQRNGNAIVVGGQVGDEVLAGGVSPSTRDKALLLVNRFSAKLLSPITAGYAAGSQGDFTLTDAFGTVVASSIPGVAGKQMSAGFDPVALAGRPGLVPLDLNGVPSIAVVRADGGSDFYVIYTQDTKSFDGGINGASKRLIVTLVVSMVVAATAVGLFWHRRQRAVTAGGERLAELIANVNDAVLVVRDGRVTYANPALETLLGVSAADAIGRELPDIFGPTGADILVQLMAATSGHERPITVGDVPCEANGQDVVWTEVTVAARHQSSSIRGSVISLHDISDRRQKSEALLHEAAHDPLTGLANRAKFIAETEQAILRARRDKNQLAVLFLDLDGFKEINDAHGHGAGDLVLTEVAVRLTSVLRGSDVAARLGGDEFAVLLDVITSLDQAQDVARRIIDGVNRPIAYAAGNLHVGVSIGIALATAADTYDALVRNADLAMYEAKESGKNAFRVARASLVGPSLPIPTPRPAASAGPAPDSPLTSTRG